MIFGLRHRSQNLRADDGQDRLRHWFNRRGWLSWGDPNQWPSSTITWQFVIGRPVYPIGASIGVEPDETYISTSVNLWPLSLHLNFETKLARRISHKLIGQKWDSEREIQMVVTSEGTIRWNLWTPSMSWSSKTPKWRNGHLNVLDFIFGQWNYANKVVSTHDVIIPMPEGGYPGTVEMWESTWTRRRLPAWVRSISRANINVKNPPEFAGKGENSWDCEDDGIFSMTCLADSVNDAIEKYQESVMRNRKRYGNPNGLDRLVSGASG